MSGSFRRTFPVGSCGSTATYEGTPAAVETVRSKRPSVAVARYGAIGSVSLQTQVVRPPLVACETRTPFAMTVRPWGTLTLKSKLALSRGLSFAGYQAGEPCGSPTTNAPSSVGTQPSTELSG